MTDGVELTTHKNTKIVAIPQSASEEELTQLLAGPAESLARGGLVCFPTETVYGLGADARDEKAVQCIFAAKGRPSDNPLIVHVGRKDDVALFAEDVTDNVERLIRAFWPGPLTLVLPKRAGVSDKVTAGLGTVALRMPAHRVALSLIRLAGTPVAAPSANLSGSPSPTSAAHVLADLAGRVDWVVDGGDSNVGLESTVLDLSSDEPAILRPGGVLANDIERELGRAVVVSARDRDGEPPKSPGMRYRHYSPKAEVSVAYGPEGAFCTWAMEKLAEFAGKGLRAGVVCSGESSKALAARLRPDLGSPIIKPWGPKSDVEALARRLYGLFREMDGLGVDRLLVEGVEPTGLGAAVMNRLGKASSGRVEKVGCPQL